MPNVSLTEAMTRFAENEVERGAYANVSEVVRAGMRMLMESGHAYQFERLREDLMEADRQIDNGEYVEFDPRAYSSEPVR